MTTPKITDEQRIARVLELYKELSQCSHESAIRDLLTDLMHYARLQGWNWNAELGMAHIKFVEGVDFEEGMK